MEKYCLKSWFLEHTNGWDYMYSKNPHSISWSSILSTHIKNRATTYRGVVDLCPPPYKYLHLLSCVLLFNGVTTLLYKHFITPFFNKSPLAHHLWCENQCVKNLSKNDVRCDASYWPRCSTFPLKTAGRVLCPPGWESCSRRILLGVNGPLKVISRHFSACKPSLYSLNLFSTLIHFTFYAYILAIEYLFILWFSILQCYLYPKETP